MCYKFTRPRQGRIPLPAPLPFLRSRARVGGGRMRRQPEGSLGGRVREELGRGCGSQRGWMRLGSACDGSREEETHWWVAGER